MARRGERKSRKEILDEARKKREIVQSAHDPATLTARERKLVKGWLAGKTKKQAADDAGMTRKEAWGRYGVIRRPRVQSLLTDALQEAGLDISDFARVIQDGLGAIKRVYTKDGNIIDEVPDHQIRYGAYDRGVAALGVVPKDVDPEEGKQQAGLQVHFHLHNTSPSPSKAKDVTPSTAQSDQSETVEVNFKMINPQDINRLSTKEVKDK